MLHMNRRVMLGYVGAGAAGLVVPSGAFAFDEASAKRLVDSLVRDINRVIDSGTRGDAMYREFKKIFQRYSDTSYISAYALGVDARRATTAQKKAFSSAFQDYIARKYGKRFEEFIGGRLEVKNVKAVKSWFEVTTMAYLQGEAPFEVNFLVSNRSGKDLFFNMYIEGVNMLLTEREEVGAMLDRRGGNIDKLIADLKAYR